MTAKDASGDDREVKFSASDRANGEGLIECVSLGMSVLKARIAVWMAKLTVLVVPDASIFLACNMVVGD